MDLTNKEKHITYTISDLKDMHIREFNLLFKNLTVKEMKWIIFDNGIWVKSNLKSREIQELFLDMVEGKVVSTEQDKIKIQKSIERKNKTKVKVEEVLDEVDSEIEILYQSFKDLKFKQENIESIVNIMNMNKIQNGTLEELKDKKQEMKSLARKIYLRVHPDKKSDKHKKYAKRFSCFNTYFSEFDLMYSREIEFKEKIKEVKDETKDIIDSVHKRKEKNSFF